MRSLTFAALAAAALTLGALSPAFADDSTQDGCAAVQAALDQITDNTNIPADALVVVTAGLDDALAAMGCSSD